MKRIGKFLTIAAIAMVSYSASAELAPQWSKGTMLANIEVGIQPVGAAASFDYVLVDEWWKGHFTIGGEFDFSSYPSIDEVAFGIAPRVTYGLNITEEFEVHAAVGVGFVKWNSKYNDIKTSGSTTLYNEFIGCRYFFADNIAGIAEVGYSNWSPEARIGLSFKF